MSERKTIVHVEDNQQTRKLVQRILSEDYELVQVERAEDALQYLAKAHLVYSDIEQPNSKGGMWLLGYILQNHPDLPVVLTSGANFTLEDFPGAKEFLQKPVNVSAIEKTIRKYSK